MLSKKRTLRPDSGLVGIPDEEISRRARDKSLSGQERKKYQTEEKQRQLRNKQKRQSNIYLDPSIPDNEVLLIDDTCGDYAPNATTAIGVGAGFSVIVWDYMLFFAIP